METTINNMDDFWDKSTNELDNIPGMTRLSTVEPKQMQWLWQPYIPTGALTIIQGDPGCGKTYLATWLAALVTNGSELPDGQKIDAASVIFQSMEDGLAEGLVPRLIAAGADMARIHCFDESSYQLNVQDLVRIETAFNLIGNVKLFVIDPIQSYLGAKTDMNRANEVRAALKGLLALCNRFNVALVVIGHMGKSANKDLYRLLGSMDFVAQARSILMVGENQSADGERVVLPIKTSNAKKGDPFAYSITDNGVVFNGFRPGFTEFDMKQAAPDGNNRVDEAARFLHEILSDRPMTVKDMEREAREADINPRSLRRAREEMKAIDLLTLRKIGNRGTWYWYMRGRKVLEVDEMLVYQTQVGHLGQHGQVVAAVGLSRGQALANTKLNLANTKLESRIAQEVQQFEEGQEGQDDHFLNYLEQLKESV